jgi:hypothetical protein
MISLARMAVAGAAAAGALALGVLAHLQPGGRRIPDFAYPAALTAAGATVVVLAWGELERRREEELMDTLAVITAMEGGRDAGVIPLHAAGGRRRG